MLSSVVKGSSHYLVSVEVQMLETKQRKEEYKHLIFGTLSKPQDTDARNNTCLSPV